MASAGRCSCWPSSSGSSRCGSSPAGHRQAVRIGPGIPIARGNLLSCSVDRDHHRHIVHAPGGQLPRYSHTGRHNIPSERPFLLFVSENGWLRKLYDGGSLCPSRCRGKLFAIRNGLPAPVVRILGDEVFGVNTHPYHGTQKRLIILFSDFFSTFPWVF